MASIIRNKEYAALAKLFSWAKAHKEKGLFIIPRSKERGYRRSAATETTNLI